MSSPPCAAQLYFSISLSRVASSATGRNAAGIFFFVLTRVASQPQQIAATVATTIHACSRLINNFRPRISNLSNLTTAGARLNAAESLRLAICSVRACYVDVKRLHSRAYAPDHFAGPESLAQQRHPAVFQIADGAKSVTRVRRLIGVQPAPRKLALERRIDRHRSSTCSRAKCFFLKSLEELPQLLLGRLRKDQAAFRRLAKRNFARFAEFPHAVHVPHTIPHQEIAPTHPPEHPPPTT